MSRREKLGWFFLGFALIVGVLSLIPAHYEICEIAEKTQERDCASYQVVPFAVIKISQFLDRGGVAVTALATIAIAWFTFSLREATDRLWDAGEKQLKFLEENAATQSRDTRDSVAAANASAKAAQKAADVSEAALIVAERPYLVSKRPNLKIFRYGPPGSPPSDPPEWVGVVEYGFTNMGRSVAFLKEVTAELIFAHDLPDRPTYSFDGGAVRTLVGHYPIKVDGYYNCVDYGVKDKIRLPQMDEIDREVLKPFFFGYVRYADIFGYLHTEGFCFRFFRISDGKSDSTCAIVGGDAFNYMRAEKIPPEGVGGMIAQAPEMSADPDGA